ncbi:hypothetical protein G7046_g4931 [Stylonectria norvegica]|nr:hypothetical protein G7046_g4931 [Stylonectria norvegica]
MATNLEVIHAYRRLYRGLLQAVQYSLPARFVARDQIREAFREPGASLNPEGIKRTVWFLEAATKEKGLEHRILKNLLEVKLKRENVKKGYRHKLKEQRAKPNVPEIRGTEYRHYDMTIAMLNKTMGLCLR